MPSFADIAKYLIPAAGFAAGTVNPRAAGVFSDLVSMRQAFSDRERTHGRQDASDIRQEASATRQARAAEIGEEEYARENEARNRQDAEVAAVMDNLPSRFANDPIVMQMAGDKDIGKILQYIEHKTQQLESGAAIKTHIAETNPRVLKEPGVMDMIDASPNLTGPYIQALMGRAAKPPENLPSTKDFFGGPALAPGEYETTTATTPTGAKVKASRSGGSKGGTSTTKIPKHQRPGYIVNTNNAFVTQANEIANEMHKLRIDKNSSGEKTRGRGRLDTGKDRDKKFAAGKSRYNTVRDAYNRNSAEMDPGFRVQMLPWADILDGKQTMWVTPKEFRTSDSDTAELPDVDAAIRGEEIVEGGLTAAEKRTSRRRVLEEKDPKEMSASEFIELGELQAGGN